MTMKRKWDKIQEVVAKKLDENMSLETQLEHWRLNRKMRKRAGQWTSDMQEIFDEMKQAVEQQDKERAEELSKQLKTEIKAETLTD